MEVFGPRVAENTAGLNNESPILSIHQYVIDNRLQVHSIICPCHYPLSLSIYLSIYLSISLSLAHSLTLSLSFLPSDKEPAVLVWAWPGSDLRRAPRRSPPYPLPSRRRRLVAPSNWSAAPTPTTPATTTTQSTTWSFLFWLKSSFNKSNRFNLIRKILNYL